ncbi:hypothetical protein H4I96_02261 [Botrytis cinerea]
MSQIDLIAIIFPKDGKADRVAELLHEISAHIKATEPGTLNYKDKAAIAAHGASEEFKAFGKQLKDEDLIAKPCN